MKKQVMLLGITVMLLLVGLSGCEEVNSFTCDNRLVGAWESKEAHMENIMFFPDGTWAAGRTEGTWDVENDQLVITKGVNSGIFYTYEYSFPDNETLILKDINSLVTYVYTKP